MTYFLLLLFSEEWKACLLVALQMEKALYMHECAHVMCVLCARTRKFTGLCPIGRNKQDLWKQ